MAHPDILVIGAGAVGASTARALALAGAKVTLVAPRQLPGEGWRAAAGMLAAQIEAGPGDQMFALGVAGRAFYRREAPVLLASTGVDIGLHQGGILQVAARDTDVPNFKAKVAWQRQQAETAEFLEPEDVREGWPWLEPGHGAFWAPEDGELLPDRLVEALLADARQLGVTVVEDQVTSLLRDNGRLLGARGSAGDYPSGQVVICAGAWSGRIANLPRPLSVEPVRGQMLAWKWPDGQQPATVYGDRCYLLHREGELVAGSTMEHVGFDASPTAEGVQSVIDRISRLAPTLAKSAPARTWAGLRPGTPDGLPIVGPEPRLPGLWYATGHGRNGILLAGITGELVAHSVAGDEPPEILHQLRPGRFWSI